MLESPTKPHAGGTVSARKQVPPHTLTHAFELEVLRTLAELAESPLASAVGTKASVLLLPLRAHWGHPPH